MNEEQREVAERLAALLSKAWRGATEHDAAALLRELLAEPVQEPTLWYRKFGAGPMLCAPDHPDARPLFASPQQRKPLTDKEIIALPAWDDYMGGCITLLDFARAIEEAHGITGEPT